MVGCDLRLRTWRTGRIVHLKAIGKRCRASVDVNDTRWSRWFSCPVHTTVVARSWEAPTASPCLAGSHGDALLIAACTHIRTPCLYASLAPMLGRDRLPRLSLKIMCAVMHLHDVGVIHKDIKASSRGVISCRDMHCGSFDWIGYTLGYRTSTFSYTVDHCRG